MSDIKQQTTNGQLDALFPSATRNRLFDKLEKQFCRPNLNRTELSGAELNGDKIMSILPVARKLTSSILEESAVIQESNYAQVRGGSQLICNCLFNSRSLPEHLIKFQEQSLERSSAQSQSCVIFWDQQQATFGLLLDANAWPTST